MVALLAALWLLIQFPISLGPVLAVVAIFCVMIGALTPDLDQPSANLLRRTIGGKFIHKLFTSFSGGHRHFTHAILGIIAIGVLLNFAIEKLLVTETHAAAQILWNAFMIGYISHPIADTLTDRGVPWFWPLPWNVKIPPGPEEVRVTTGSFVENILVRGAIIVAFAFLIITNSSSVIMLFARP